MMHSSKNYLIVNIDDRPDSSAETTPDPTSAISLGISLIPSITVVSGIVTHDSWGTMYPKGTRVWFEGCHELLMLVDGVKYSAVKTSAIIAYESK